MKFLLDAQLPPRLTRALTRGGHVAVHVTECGLLTAKDTDIWKYAAKQKAVVITKDADFAAMRLGAFSGKVETGFPSENATVRKSRGPAVVWLRLGSVTNDALIEAVVAALPEIVAAIEAGEGLVEVR
jgi:predicted nuclease of predicted toxin-antitoxin system